MHGSLRLVYIVSFMDCVCDNVRSMSKDWCKGLVCRCFSRGRGESVFFVGNGPDVCVRLAGIPVQSSDCKATESYPLSANQLT